MKWPMRVTVVAVLLCAGWLYACDETGPLDGGVEPPDPTCIDRDGDGHGVNCVAGLDCNDSDPDIAVGCVGFDPCSTPNAGCPCPEDGEIAECRTTEPIVTPDGTRMCYLGEITCIEGEWGACEGMEPYPPAGESTGSDDGDGVHREPILGFPRDCTGTCDPDCMNVHDCPAGRDLTPANSTNLTYDPVNLSPPAVILEDLADPGFFRREMMAECDYNEMFVWWSVGFNIDATAPQTFILRARTAPTQPLLASAPWRTVVNCPTVQCALPVNPDDRAYNEGILYNALIADGVTSVRNAWLEYEVQMRANGAATSPEFTWLDFYFFCEEAT